MKKLLFIAFAIVMIGCKNEVKPDYAIISGKITNKAIGDLTINSMDRAFTKTLKVSEDGSFLDTLSTNINSYVLYDGINPVFIYIDNGYNLNINYDSKYFESSLNINGEGSGVNNYLIAKRQNEQKLIGNNVADFYKLNENDYKEKLQFMVASQDSLLNESKDIPTDFKIKEERNNYYFSLKLLQDYEPAHKHFTDNKNFKVSEDFLSELNDLDYLNEEDFNFSMFYKVLIEDNFKKEAKILSAKDSLTSDEAYFKVLSSIESETIKNGLLFDFANNKMNYSKDKETFYKTFLENSTNEKNNALIIEKYDKLTALSEGKPSPEFTNYKNYDGGTTSLADFKGKYVYIDVWATWCGPCIGEIPALQKVEKQYHGKNIEFVSVSIDKVSDFEKWKTMVTDKELKGVQVFADNDWNSSFVKDYQIQGIPRFILIDPKGNIVRQNAPRPSSPRLIELFTELSI